MSVLQELFRGISGAFRWWVVVAPWERAVRVRRGKYMSVLEPGMHVRVPLLDRVFRQSIRRRFSSCSTQTVTTADGKTVTVSGAMRYSIVDIGLLYNTLHHAEDTIEGEATGLISRFIAATAFGDCGPRAIEEHVKRELNLRQYGLDDVDFFITDFACVRTFRLIQGQPKDWHTGDSLSTAVADGEPQPS